jgi:hypothetical protein
MRRYYFVDRAVSEPYLLAPTDVTRELPTTLS